MGIIHDKLVMRGEIPRYKAAYDRLEKLFQDKSDPWNFEKDNYEQARLRKVADVVSRLPHASVLEVGCAEGAMTRLLCEVSPDVTAFDVSETAVERTKQAAPKSKALTATLEDFNPGRRYDVAVCCETLYYVDDVPKALAKLNSLADFVVLTYTLYEKQNLDKYTDSIPTISREKFTYLKFFDSGRLINWRGIRVLVWHTGALKARP